MTLEKGLYWSLHVGWYNTSKEGRIRVSSKVIAFPDLTSPCPVSVVCKYSINLNTYNFTLVIVHDYELTTEDLHCTWSPRVSLEMSTLNGLNFMISRSYSQLTDGKIKVSPLHLPHTSQFASPQKWHHIITKGLSGNKYLGKQYTKASNAMERGWCANFA